MNRNITATILIILAIGIYFTVTKNMLEAAQGVKAQNEQYLSAIASAQKLVQIRDQVQQNYNNISARDRDNLVKMIPNTVDNIRLIIDTNSIANAHGLTLTNITAAADSSSSHAAAPASAPAGSATAAAAPASITAPTLDTVTVSFSVTATYEQFQSFLQDLESNLRLMDVTHLSLSQGEKGMYGFAVELKTYWLRQ
jgi:Tfp pilus assembly protein PilO